VCWSGGIAGESFSDSSAANVYQEVVSRTSTVECAGAWARAAETATITETVSWAGTVNAILNIYDASGSTGAIAVLRTSGTGAGAPLSLDSISAGATSAEIACYGTDSPVTLAAGTSFTLDGTSAIGGCEHATNIPTSTDFPMTASPSATWAGIGLVILPQSAGITQCTGDAVTAFSCTTADPTNQVGIGDLLVVSASRENAGGVWTISDNTGDVWTSVGSVSNTAKAEVWYTVAKTYGYDQVTVNFADLYSEPVTVSIMDCGPECTNQSIAYSTGTGTGTSFSVASQTMAIGPGFATVATASSPGTLAPGPGFTAASAGSVESAEFSSQTSDACPASGTISVPWAEICVSFRTGMVETLNLNPGPGTAAITPSNYFTLSYRLDGVTKSLSLGASVTTWVDDQADTDSISPTTSQSTPTHQWAILLSDGEAVSQTWSSGTTAPAVSETYLYYEQYRPTFEITARARTTFDSSTMTLPITCDELGSQVTAATVTTASGSATASAAGWCDIDSVATFPQYTIAPPSNEEWENGVGAANSTREVVSAFTVNNDYYNELQNTFTVTPTAHWDAGRTITFDGVVLGTETVPTGCSFTPTAGTSSMQSCTVWTDYNQVFDFNPSTGGASSTVWGPNPYTQSGITTGGNKYNSAYTLMTSTTTTTTTSTSSTTASTVLTTTTTAPVLTTTVTQTETVTMTATVVQVVGGGEQVVTVTKTESAPSATSSTQEVISTETTTTTATQSVSTTITATYTAPTIITAILTATITTTRVQVGKGATTTVTETIPKTTVSTATLTTKSTRTATIVTTQTNTEALTLSYLLIMGEVLIIVFLLVYILWFRGRPPQAPA
jgi:hypothetical protein